MNASELRQLAYNEPLNFFELLESAVNAGRFARCDESTNDFFVFRIAVSDTTEVVACFHRTHMSYVRSAAFVSVATKTDIAEIFRSANLTKPINLQNGPENRIIEAMFAHIAKKIGPLPIEPQGPSMEEVADMLEARLS